MKFGDIIIAAATLSVIVILLETVLLLAFVPAMSHSGIDVAVILSTLVGSLVVGYLFALKIQEESRVRSVASIVVLFALVTAFGVMAIGANPLASPAFKDAANSVFSTGGWTNYDWFNAVFVLVTLNIVYALVFGFIGMYAGSMLRKPKKT